MSKRQDVLSARVRRLEVAIIAACARTGASEQVIDSLVVEAMNSKVVPRIKDFIDHWQLTVELELVSESSPTLEIGPAPEYEFLMLRLAPTRGCIVMYLDFELDDDVLYVPVSSADLVEIYTGREIQRLVKLLNSL